MKCKKIVIETDGTTEGTKIKVDGEILGYIQRVEFFADATNKFSKILIEKSLIGVDNQPKMRKVQVRNLGTEKFEDSMIPITEPVPVEFIKNK